MAPKKAPAAPKRTIDDVNAEYSALQAAADARTVELRRRVKEAKDAAEAARLDLVTLREKKIFYDAKVEAEAAMQNTCERDMERDVQSFVEALQQARRQSQDKSYEIAYVRDVMSAIEQDVTSVEQSIAAAEIDAAADTAEFEQEMDRLAQTAAFLSGESAALERTLTAARDAEASLSSLAPPLSVPVPEPYLQVTFIGSSCVGARIMENPSIHHEFTAPAARSLRSPESVLNRLREALTTTCGFHVAEDIRPDCLSPLAAACQRFDADAEASLKRRILTALTRAGSGAYPGDVQWSAHHMVVIHCAAKVRYVSSPQGTPDPQQEIILVISKMPDDLKRIMHHTAAYGNWDVEGAGVTEIPLATVCSAIMSCSTRPQMTLVVDTWPAPQDVESAADHKERLGDRRAHPHSGFCLFWAKQTDGHDVGPLIYKYRSSAHDFQLAEKRHMAASNHHLYNSNEFSRGILVELISSLLLASPASHVVDSVVMGQCVESIFASQQYSGELERLAAPFRGTPFGSIALPLDVAKRVFHHLPPKQRPFTAPRELHFEGRSLLHGNVDLSPVNGSSDSTGARINHKWKSQAPSSAGRPSSVSALRSARLDERTLVQHHAEVVSAAPHARWLVDLAIEDPAFLEVFEEIEDLSMERALEADAKKERQLADAAVLSGDSPLVGTPEVTGTSSGVEVVASAAAVSVRVTAKRQRPMRTDTEEWGQLVARRVQQALIVHDENHAAVRRKWLQRDPLIASFLPAPSSGGAFPFTVAVQPLPYEAAQTSLRHLWYPHPNNHDDSAAAVQEIVSIMTLVLHAKPLVAVRDDGSVSFEHVTQAKDALAHSIGRALELICEEIALASLSTTGLEVQYRVNCVRSGDVTHNDTHFRADVEFVTTLPVGDGLLMRRLEMLRWIRRAFTSASKRWLHGSGKEWHRCAEMEGSVEPSHQFRVTHLFHVLRGWEIGIRLEQLHGISVVESRARLEWLQHLMFRLAASGGGRIDCGSAAESCSVRVLDVREWPRFVGLQRAVPVSVGDDNAVDGVLGSGSCLNRMLASELCVAIARIREWHVAQQPLPIGLLPSASSSADTVSNESLRSPSSQILLCWVLPSEWQHSEGADARQGRFMVHSLIRQFHRQHRVIFRSTGEAVRVTLFATLCVAPEVSQVTASLNSRSSFSAAEAVWPVSVPSKNSSKMHLRLGDLKANDDEDTDAAGKQTPRGDGGAAGKGSIAEGSMQESPCNGNEEDETFRPLPHCQDSVEDSTAAYSARSIVSILPRRFWDSMNPINDRRNGIFPYLVVAAWEPSTDTVTPHVFTMEESLSVSCLKAQCVEHFVASLAAVSVDPAASPARENRTH